MVWLYYLSIALEIEIQDVNYQYLYHDDTTLFLSDPKTFEQLEVSLSLVDPAILKSIDGKMMFSPSVMFNSLSSPLLHFPSLAMYHVAGASMRVRMKADDMQPIQVLVNTRGSGRPSSENNAI